MRLLSIVAVLLLAPLAQARTLVDLDLPVGAESPAQAALAAVKARAAFFGGRGASLTVTRVHAIEGGQVVRVGQRHAGLRVLGAEVAVTIQRGRIVALSGKLHDLGGLDSSPAGLIPAATAMAAAVAELPTGRARRAELVIWRGERVFLVDTISSDPFGLWRSLVSAREGKVLWRRSTILAAGPQVLGRVYRHNPQTGPLLDLPLLGLADPSVLAGSHADVKSCTATQTSLDCTRHAKPAGGHFLFAPSDPDFADPFAEVQAYHHVDSFHRFMQRRFEFSRQGSQQIAVFANLATIDKNGKLAGYPNAFFGDLDGDGKGDLALGQSARDFAYDGDVVYHEFGHSAVAETSGLEPDIDELGFNAMPLGLNEGFADLLSSFHTGDPVVGEYAGAGSGIRNLVGTASCPASLTGESHSDGLIWGRTVWSIRARQHRPEAFEEVLYKTMVGLTPHAELADAAALLQKLASLRDAALGAEVGKELKLRGVDTCSRIVPLAPGQTLKGYILGRAYLPGLPVAPGPLQYRIDVPADAVQLDLKLSGAQLFSSKIAGAYIRRDLPVAYGTKVSYDLAKPSNVSILSLTLADTTNRLQPGASYYILPVNEGSYETTYAIQVTLTRDQTSTPPPPALEPDGGVAPLPPPNAPPAAPAAPGAEATTDDPAAGGCACRLDARPDGGFVLTGLLLLALLLRARRRAR
jgi:hypothetical protein